MFKALLYALKAVCPKLTIGQSLKGHGLLFGGLGNGGFMGLSGL
jgi:hypothetical protein